MIPQQIEDVARMAGYVTTHYQAAIDVLSRKKHEPIELKDGLCPKEKDYLSEWQGGLTVGLFLNKI